MTDNKQSEAEVSPRKLTRLQDQNRLPHPLCGSKREVPVDPKLTSLLTLCGLAGKDDKIGPVLQRVTILPGSPVDQSHGQYSVETVAPDSHVVQGIARRGNCM